MSEFVLYTADADVTEAQRKKAAVEAALKLIEVDLANKHNTSFTSLDAHLDRLHVYADKILDALQ